LSQSRAARCAWPDLAIRHLAGDLAAHARGFAMALHGGEIEPLVRGNEIGRRRASRRAVDAELVERIRARIGGRKRAGFVTGSCRLPHLPIALRFPWSCKSQPALTKRCEQRDYRGEELNGGLSVAMKRR
jgi:hypothetical protein